MTSMGQKLLDPLVKPLRDTLHLGGCENMRHSGRSEERNVLWESGSLVKTGKRGCEDADEAV
jgi:hypothetical protein